MPAIRPWAALLCAALAYGSAYAQQQTSLTYDISTETAVGSGDYTAYQLVSNRHHILSTRANTGYLRAALTGEHRLSEHWSLSGAVDAVASLHADHPAYLQQCYLNLSWREFYLEAGTRERGSVMLNDTLTSGALINSGNAKPVPQVRIGTNQFWTVPGLRHWLMVYGDASYGHFLDGGYLTDQFALYQQHHLRSYVTTDVWYHQKRLYIQSDDRRRFYVTIGMEHAVQFGGRNRSYTSGHEVVTSIAPSFADFFRVILPLGDGNTGTTTNKAQEWVKGNHLGSWNLKLTCNLSPHQQLRLYGESMFEDGSGIRKGNGLDGLWGIEYRNSSTQQPILLRQVVLEHLITTDQSGPIHWAPDDFSAQVQGPLPGHSTGNDNYYNNYMYNGYAHYGMSIGTPLLVSPCYNADHYMSFTDTRVKAWHLGMRGEFSNHFGYLLRGSYREGWGTYFVPLQKRNHSFDAVIQGIWHQGPWQVAAAYAIDRGNIYGDCSTFDFKFTYHGKIL